jgi:hypothetical protein
VVVGLGWFGVGGEGAVARRGWISFVLRLSPVETKHLAFIGANLSNNYSPRLDVQLLVVRRGSSLTVNLVLESLNGFVLRGKEREEEGEGCGGMGIGKRG